jgi:deoxycytidylate deaminase
MHLLEGLEAEEARKYLLMAAQVADDKSTCRNARCGAVIVKDDQVIGEGYNSPPLDKEEFRTCGQEYDRANKPKTNFDTTCCIHAEWRAVLDASRRNPDKLQGSICYFAHPDGTGELAKGGGKLYCTTCSRLLLESGVAEFAHLEPSGIVSYPLPEMNRRSYEFFK